MAVVVETNKDRQKPEQVTFNEPKVKPPIIPVHVRKELAKAADTSTDAVRKVEKILEEAKPEDIEAMP